MPKTPYLHPTVNVRYTTRFLDASTQKHRLSYIGIEEYGRESLDMLTGETVLRHRIGALELLDGEPHLYHFGDGRLVLEKDSLPRLQYKLSDHLGNTVVLFEDRNGNGVVEEISGQPENSEVLQRQLYYPFGLALRGPMPQQPSPAQDYRYNGKERLPGSEIYAYGFRHYDPVVGRFLGVDPLAGEMAAWSPYAYTFDNPLRFVDPDGRAPESTIVKSIGNGKYKVIGGNPNDGDNNIYVVNDSGQKSFVLGQSITSHSFFGEDNEAVMGAIIDMNSKDGMEFINNEIVATDIGLVNYISNAKGGERLDFKTRGIDNREVGTSRQQYVYRGSVTNLGKIGSARDFGNIGAGIVAGRNYLLGWEEARLGFDGLQSFQEGKFATEGIPTQKAQRVGFSLGDKLRKNDSYYFAHGYHNKPYPVKSIEF